MNPIEEMIYVPMLDGKFWGTLYADGHSTSNGWTDDIRKAIFSNNTDRVSSIPEHFTYTDSPDTKELIKGKMYKVKRVTSYEIIEEIPRVDKIRFSSIREANKYNDNHLPLLEVSDGRTYLSTVVTFIPMVAYDLEGYALKRVYLNDQDLNTLMVDDEIIGMLHYDILDKNNHARLAKEKFLEDLASTNVNGPYSITRITQMYYKEENSFGRYIDLR